jgi:hypothetical protein
MSNVPENMRPFNLEQAKAGAPVTTAQSFPVDIIKWDLRNTYNKPLLGIVKYAQSDQFGSWTKGGLTEGGDIFMAPLFYVDEKPVFMGDMLEMSDKGSNTWDKIQTGPSCVRFSNAEYRWPELVMFKGQELTLESHLWYKNAWEGRCLLVVAGTTIGNSTHFNRVIQDPGTWSDQYSWDKPIQKKEVWQAKVKSVTSSGKSYYAGSTHPTQSLCERAYRTDNTFISADLISTYYE